MKEKQPLDSFSPFIEVSSLSKIYPYKGKVVHALRCVSFSIYQGDVYGIIGLSGAGKSTLLRCLATLLPPSSGKILFQNEDIYLLKKEKLRQFRQKIGMIFQHFNLFSSRTVFGNIAYPLEISGLSKEEIGQRVGELLHLVGLSSKRDNYPSSLSGGEKQRVGIARALASHPEVLFCDEATSALDPRTRKEILNLLTKIQKNLGITLVLITHDMEVIKQICNKVAVMEEGAIVEEGEVSAVFADPKHGTTKQFIQGASHEIPKEFLRPPSPHRKLIRFRFKGSAASEPLISEIVQQYQVSANILLGWLDRLQTHTVGTLVIEITGIPEKIEEALIYLTKKEVHYEILEGT